MRGLPGSLAATTDGVQPALDALAQAVAGLAARAEGAERALEKVTAALRRPATCTMTMQTSPAASPFGGAVQQRRPRAAEPPLARAPPAKRLRSVSPAPAAAPEQFTSAEEVEDDDEDDGASHRLARRVRRHPPEALSR